MIVLKFGGTSVADSSRLDRVCQLVKERVDRRPIVVVSALAQVTDLLLQAVARAGAGDREAVDAIVADLERRHRWLIAGAIGRPAARHDLSLKVDALFEELRQLLRSIRVLRDATPRSTDALLAFGEALSATILAAALREQGVTAVQVDPRSLIATDGCHGAAEPDVEATERLARERLIPRIEAGEVPVTGGFVGVTADGVTTTLGRGGSDTTACVLGSALRAEEVQIWTDVDGLMSADPRIVPDARLLSRVSFAEAAELAYYGAKVLHPASISSAVRRGIPVRVRNTLRPESSGTLVVPDESADTDSLASIASRGGLALVRVVGNRMRMEPGLLLRILEALRREGAIPALLVCSEVGVCFVVPRSAIVAALERELSGEAVVSVLEGRAIVCVVGSGLRSAGVRGRVLTALAALDPELVAIGASGASASAVVRDERLDDAVRAVHERFFVSAGSP